MATDVCQNAGPFAKELAGRKECATMGADLTRA